MTRAELVEKARGVWEKVQPWLPLILLAVVLLVVLGVVRGCNRGGEAARALEVAKGELAADDAQVPVVHRAEDQDQVDDRVAALERANELLRAERDRARKALGALEARLVIQARTAPAVASGPPAPPPMKGAPCPACQLLVGEALQLGADLVVDQLPGGAHIATGTLEAAGPRGLLLRAPYSAPVTEGLESPPPASAADGWRAGPLGGASGHGWLLGGLLATPEGRLPLIGWGVSGALVVAGGPSEGLALAGFTIRP